MAENTKIMPVEECKAIGKCYSSPSSWGNYMPEYMRYREKTVAVIAPYAMEQLQKARAADVATHEKNLPALENNRAIAARVTELMKEIGMPERWSELVHGRGRYPKRVGHEAGWITDLRRECKTSDGFELASDTYGRLKKDYEAYVEQGKRDAEQAERARQREQEALVEKRKADMELATILLRYQLPVESTWQEVLRHLCAKNQRINLAVAMQQTRMDWNEGPYRVSDALRAFTIETNEDKDIAADVAQHLVDFDDGRCFRDTTWSYDALFASVEDRQLVADAQLALQRGSDHG